MKKYLRNILIFVFIIAWVDVLFGLVCQYMNDHSKGGGIKSRHYVCKESNEDILIFGSSRAKHHYVPVLFEDSLGMSCYNTGEDGNGIIYCYGILKMITDRYTPKLIIYDVSAFDLYQDDNMKYLDLLKPFYYEHGIDSIFWKVEPKTRLMMCSSLYRYNTTCFRVLGNYLKEDTQYEKGYYALNGSMKKEPKTKGRKIGNLDSLKISYFEKFLQLTNKKNILVICIGSPYYDASVDDGYYLPIKDVCDKYNVSFLDYTELTSVKRNRSLFKDRVHLNNAGARIFTVEIVKEIKDNIKSISNGG